MFLFASTPKSVKAVIVSTVFLSSLLAGCGGGGGGDAGSNANGTSEGSRLQADAVTVSQSTASTANISGTPATRQEAARFLTQATFGPTTQDVDRLMSIGYAAWFQEQFSAQPARSYRSYWDMRDAALKATRTTGGATVNEINHAFWTNAITSPDQLRQRVAFALSEIFVISTQDGCGNNLPQGVASYFDMLGQRAFGSYRQLLESVTLHPVMGCFLSHFRNQKEDPLSGRVPDENYAREVMQLFSIGLHQLNADGTEKLASNGQPIETYSQDDISGLAKVFTGWAHACPDWPSDNCFKWSARTGDNAMTADRWAVPMRPYARFHSTSEKRFLGKVIPVQQVADPEGSLKIALDTLSTHANVGPFIGKQLIQRLVTSNPSPAYVQRVSQAFTSSGGNLQTTVVAILMDAEARDMTKTQSASFGKVREPILKLSAFLRAYGAKSDTGNFLVYSTADAGTGLGQNPLQAPSVFNFFRPGYVPPGSETARVNMVAPEMQLMHETSAAGYVNYMRTVISWGLGAAGYDNKGSAPDIHLPFQRNTSDSLYNLAQDPAALTEDINQRLMYGTMPQALKTEITSAVSSIYYGSKSKQSAEDKALTTKLRLWSALLLAVSSPEFQVQK